MRLTYIGGKGATLGAGIGAGKPFANLLIIRVGVRGVTKLKTYTYTRAGVRVRAFTGRGSRRSPDILAPIPTSRCRTPDAWWR